MEASHPNKRLNKPWLYIGLCLASYVFGGLFIPGEWYQQLNRAPWNPPDIAFPIAWTILYAMIAVAGIKCQQSNDKQLLNLWFIQLFFNAIWSWVFFGQHWILLGLINIVILLILVGLFILKAYMKSYYTLVALMSPYFVWLTLATSLNAYIYLYNN